MEECSTGYADLAKWLPILRRFLALVMISTGLGLLYTAFWVA